MPTSNCQLLLIYRIDLPSKSNSILAFTLSTFFASAPTTQDDRSSTARMSQAIQ